MTNHFESEQVEIASDDRLAEAMETNDTDGDDIHNSAVNSVSSAQELDCENGLTAMEDDSLADQCRAEATFQYKIENISKMKDQTLSHACIVRNLPWKILAMHRTAMQDRGQIKTLGFFLQCNAQSESLSWSCNASAELRMLKQTGENREPFVRRIQHLFYAKENDWGFSNFLPWYDMLEPSKGYVKDDSIILEVYVMADAPHGVSWDSKKHTGYVGLKNQGATCYMNSLLQSLYFTNKLRKSVYKMPTENDGQVPCVALALQRVFYDLQTCEKPVGTKKLTKSFGWETLETFMQHDVQEFCRVLLDNIENKMKGTCVDGTIPSLFEGKTLSYIKCKNVDYVSAREETYYDIQLNVKGKKSVKESFDTYVEAELLDGDNKYDAGDHGLQEAEKGVTFLRFPPVLHLQLMRFQYDPMTDTNVKINDRFEFPEELDLTSYLKEPEETPAVYRLHAVLVHSGDNHGGHYVGYIDPRGDGRWCKFDDDVVSRCTIKEAVDRNFGGHDDDISAKHSTNAYMLVYIRKSELKNILEPITEDDIPKELVQRLVEEREIEAQKRRERNEAHLYMTVNVVLEDVFESHHGHDLFDIEKAQDSLRSFRVKKQDTLEELLVMLAKTLNFKPENIRLWPFQMRQNQTYRPTVLEFPPSEYSCKTIEHAADRENPWYVFVETLPVDSPELCLPDFDKNAQVCLFIKRYDPKTETLSYCGHIYFPITIVINNMMPVLSQKAGFPKATRLIMFEEVKPNMIEKIDFTSGTLERELDELMDGDILIVQKELEKYDNYRLPTAKEYSRELHYQVDVVFCDKNDPNDQGFTLQLSLKMNYADMAKRVGEHLLTDPYMLQFFRSVGYKDGPGSAIKCTYEGALKDIFSPARTNIRSPKKLHYQKLSMKITELENKKQFRCMYMGPKMKEEKELVLHPDKNGTVEDLLHEASKQLQLVGGSNKLRLLEITSFKITNIFSNSESLENIAPMSNRCLCVEEVPGEELVLGNNELLIPVAHFYQETYALFGTPFLVKIKEGEPFTDLRERVRKKLDISEKEYDTFKFAVMVMGRKTYIENEDDYIVHITEFRPATTSHFPSRPWLGLDHVNKAPKRGRYSYQEKAIKIHH